METIRVWMVAVTLVCCIVPSDGLAAAHRLKLAVMPIAARGVEERVSQTLADIMTVEIGKLNAFDVISSDEINALLGMERMQDAIGCDDLACTSELGGALGVDLLISGAVARLGSKLNVSLTLFDVTHTRVLRRTREAVDNEENLLEAVVLRSIGQLFPEQTAAITSSSGGRPPWQVVSLVGAGLVSALGLTGGVIFARQASGERDALSTLAEQATPLSLADYEDRVAAFESGRALSGLSFGVAALAAIGGVVVLLSRPPRSEPPTVTVAPLALVAGGGVQCSVRW